MDDDKSRNAQLYSDLVDKAQKVQDLQNALINDLVKKCDKNQIPIPTLEKSSPFFTDFMETCEQLYNFEKANRPKNETLSKFIKPLVIHLFERETPKSVSKSQQAPKKKRSYVAPPIVAIQTTSAAEDSDDDLTMTLDQYQNAKKKLLESISKDNFSPGEKSCKGVLPHIDSGKKHKCSCEYPHLHQHKPRIVSAWRNRGESPL